MDTVSKIMFNIIAFSARQCKNGKIPGRYIPLVPAANLPLKIFTLRAILCMIHNKKGAALCQDTIREKAGPHLC